MADVKWIKLATDIFDNRKIRQIECLPDGDAIIVVWVKLMCLAGNINDSGFVYFTKEIPYTDQMLASQFNRPLTTVQLSLKTFEQFGMIEVIDNVLHISNWEKYQSVDRLAEIREYNRIAKQKSRARRKLLPDVNDKSMTSQRCHETDIEEDKDIEEELEVDKKSKTDFQSVIDLYHKICVSFPSVRSLSEARKKAIRARLNTYTLDDFKTVFENAEASSFLKGGNDRNWSANFDWLIADKNMAKVLEGNYADKPKQGRRKEAVPSWMERAERKDEFAATVQQSVRAMHEQKGNDPELAERVKRLRERLGE